MMGGVFKVLNKKHPCFVGTFEGVPFLKGTILRSIFPFCGGGEVNGAFPKQPLPPKDVVPWRTGNRKSPPDKLWHFRCGGDRRWKKRVGNAGLFRDFPVTKTLWGGGDQQKTLGKGLFRFLKRLGWRNRMGWEDFLSPFGDFLETY